MKIHENEALDAQGLIFWGPGPIFEGVEKSTIFWSASGRPKINKNRSLERSGVEKYAPIVRRSGGGVDFGPRVKGLRD